ncbi:MAG TPA: hypothetical protein P5228_12025 [Bacteroidales bacterium]|nr:hypothetical protein [Bacteroidales bacterium]HRZ48123.1 hypothetical protein [Bacteroidales bacterium]
MYHFQNIADHDNCDRKDKGIFQDDGTILPLEYQMKAQESDHETYRDQRRIGLETFGQITAQQGCHTPLQTAAGAIDTKNFFIETSHGMAVEPFGCPLEHRVIFQQI